MAKQNLNKLPTKKMKGLRKTVAEKKIDRKNKVIEKRQKKKSNQAPNSIPMNSANLQPLPANSAIAKLNTSRPKMLSVN